MTPALQHLLHLATCPTCLGEGMLGGRGLKSIGGAEFYESAARVCETCEGTGCDPAYRLVIRGT